MDTANNFPAPKAWQIVHAMEQASDHYIAPTISTFALVYNIISIPVAAGGFLNPIIAATAMLFSSLSVTCNTLLLVKQESKNKPVS